MPICKVACNFIAPANLLQIFGTPFPKKFAFQRLLNKPCHFKFARNHSESTKGWANCMWDFYRP